MDNVIRRRSLALVPSDETTAGVEEPPSPEGFGPIVSEHQPEWVVRLTRLSRTTHAQTEFTIHRLHRWMELNRELTLRLTAHGIILVAITATLGLSHVRLADLRLPSLATPANRAAPVWTDSGATTSDSESFIRRPMVPRTASAVNIRMSPNDAASLAPREDLFAAATRLGETRIAPPSAMPSLTMPSASTGPTEPMVDAPTPEIPTLESLIQSYVVENGDTLLAIAYKFDINLEALVAANPFLRGSLNTIFHPGDEFIIPPPGGMLHIVKDGDTLQSLASKYEVEVSDIVSYGPNRLTADSVLFPSQQVFVPQGAFDLPRATPQPAVKSNTLAGVLQPRTTTTTTTAPVAKPATTTTTTTAAPKPAAVTQPTVASGTLRTPLYGYVITQNFWAYHNGVDLAAPIGTPVYAADAGRVIYSGWDNTGYGYMLLIDHGNGYRTRYAHLSWIFPSYGTYIAKGEQIGKVGSTGRSSGPHLHFEVIINGIARNPFAYIR